jgi:simple sugar transport system permease protein
MINNSLLNSIMNIMIPLLFAAAGGLFPALAGTLNIALEGLLLIGAFSAIAVFSFTGSIFAAIMAAAVSGIILSTVHAITAFKLRANVFITGLAVNLFASGISVILSDKIFNTRGVVTTRFINLNSFLYMLSALIIILIVSIILYKTPFGLRLRSCDKYSDTLISLGIKPDFYRTAALLISGFFCGIGGSFLSLNLGAFVPGLSAGRGWIAIVIIYLGGRNPYGILGAALIFTLIDVFSIRIQGYLRIPSDFILAFPYICILLALILLSIHTNRKKI